VTCSVSQNCAALLSYWWRETLFVFSVRGEGEREGRGEGEKEERKKWK